MNHNSHIQAHLAMNLKEEECLESRTGKRRSWDDEYVLKRQFTALIPAFDPRPGRTNVNQISELDIPPPETSSSVSREIGQASEPDCIAPQPKLRLVLRGPNLPGV